MIENATNDLAEWLLERIAEDEEVARAAAEQAQRWRGKPPVADWSVVLRDYGGIEVWEAGGDEGDGIDSITEHMERWDPARALAECEAKRRIVEKHSFGWVEHGAYRTCIEDNYEWPCHTLRLLALPYADRDGYDPAWRP